MAEEQALQQEQPELEATTDDRPDWLLDRYQDVEAQARAYAEAERRMTEAAQRASAAEQTVAQMAERMQAMEEAQQQAQYQQPAYDAQTDPYLLAAQQAFEEGDYMRAQQINDMRTAQIVQTALQQWAPQQQEPAQNMDITGALLARDMKDRYGEDWEQIRGEVTQVAAQYLDPAMPYERMRETLSFIGDKVANDRRLADQTQQLQRQQQSDQQKRLAQTAPGGGAWNNSSPGGDDRREQLRQQWRDMGLIPGQ